MKRTFGAAALGLGLLAATAQAQDMMRDVDLFTSVCAIGDDETWFDQGDRGAGVFSNRGFAGVYGFDRMDYAACFAEWLQAAAPGMLIMCHPAAAVGSDDEIAAQRLVEYRFLKSPEFLQMLQGAGVALTPLSTMDLAS